MTPMRCLSVVTVVGAVFTAAPAAIHVDDDAPNDPGPGNPAVSDPLEDGSIEHPFDDVQEAIQAAEGGDEIRVAPGTYPGGLSFLGKAVRVIGIGGPEVTFVDCDFDGDVSGVTCEAGEGPDSVLRGITVTRCFTGPGGGMSIWDASPTVIDCAFIDNAGDAGVVPVDLDGHPRLVDDPETPDTGNPDGARSIVDMGAFEFCRADANRDGAVDVDDLVAVVLA